MMGHPGKKLMFMGCEFGQFVEWREWEELQWNVIEEFDIHRKTKEYFKALNHFYLENSSLWSLIMKKKALNGLMLIIQKKVYFHL